MELGLQKQMRRVEELRLPIELLNSTPAVDEGRLRSVCVSLLARSN